MRYFLLLFILTVAVVVTVAGKRGDHSRRTPIEIFDDMDRMPKLRPQEPNRFFPDAISSRLPVDGTVPRTAPKLAGGRLVSSFEDSTLRDIPANTGRVPGTTNFVETIPVPVTAQSMARGQERYQITCSPCHGAVGDGNGITKKIGAMGVVASLHDPRIVKLTDGELFSVVSHGKNLMQGYAANVDVPDRWAIIAYLRALQLSRLGKTNDVPAEFRTALKK
jgi:mono/diheme cytochrome c family protein